jgi:hypothetical protein
VPGIEQLIKKLTLLAFNALNLFAHTRAAQQLGDDFIMSCHV